MLPLSGCCAGFPTLDHPLQNSDLSGFFPGLSPFFSLHTLSSWSQPVLMFQRLKTDNSPRLLSSPNVSLELWNLQTQLFTQHLHLTIPNWTIFLPFYLSMLLSTNFGYLNEWNHPPSSWKIIFAPIIDLYGTYSEYPFLPPSWEGELHRLHCGISSTQRCT